MRNKTFESMYADNVTQVNPIQMQTFNTLYNLDENLFIGCPLSLGKLLCTDFAILSLFGNDTNGKCI